jgi:hypothetical protein
MFELYTVFLSHRAIINPLKNAFPITQEGKTVPRETPVIDGIYVGVIAILNAMMVLTGENTGAENAS